MQSESNFVRIKPRFLQNFSVFTSGQPLSVTEEHALYHSNPASEMVANRGNQQVQQFAQQFLGTALGSSENLFWVHHTPGGTSGKDSYRRLRLLENSTCS